MAEYKIFESVQAQKKPDCTEIVLRDEQVEAVKKAKSHFGSTPRGGEYVLADAQKQFLWNAKMRFGKTICAMQLVKEMGVKRVLIVTHRPVVNNGFHEDFEKIFGKDNPNWKYGSKSDKGNTDKGDFYALNTFSKQGKDNHFVFFASMQYLRRSTLVRGDNDEQLKKDLLLTDWDLVVVDEAHEGTRTSLGQRVIDTLKKENTKMLHLSGTPFNLYGDFKDNEIYTWDYIQEQQAKKEFAEKHPLEYNPYAELPQMKIFTYSLDKLFDQFVEEGASFKFSEFFRTWTGNPKADKAEMPAGAKGRFVHEAEVNKFLDMLCDDSKDSNYPFSRATYQENFNHSLWIVPGVKEAKALEDLLNDHPVFGDFEVKNVAGNGLQGEEADDALDAVKNAIGAQPREKYTITISCGRLTTGVTVKEWTAVLYLKGSEMTSAATYMQTIFRVQSPWVDKEHGDMKSTCCVFDFAPDRTLKMVAETAKFSSMAKKKTAKKETEDERETQEHRDKETMQAFIDLCPVISLDGGKMAEFDVNTICKKLENVYIDRLVRSGFDDNCLYNPDELNKLDAAMLNTIGKNGGEAPDEKRKAASGDANVSQLTDEQRALIEEARRKRKENKQKHQEWWDSLSDEERAAIEAEREEKKRQREEFKKRVSNIRGIALRIPLLMFGGADKGNTKTPLTVDNFTELISDESWNEFMPKGISKEDFNKIRKCFNATRFEEAGKKYRALAIEADDMHIDDRMDRITTIHSWFKNPDKETVLTPWNVVNMHLHTALGGYSFFDPQDYKSPVMKEASVKDDNGNVKTEPIEIAVTEQPAYREGITNEVFGTYDSGKDAIQTRILEINSKTGLYPLYMAYTLYRLQMDAYIREKAYDNIDNLSVDEEQTTWDNVIKNNIFVICNTKMAAQITFRTLMGFRNEDKGQHHIKTTNLVERALDEADRNDLIAELQSGSFWGLNDCTMTFNAVVGNPPYQKGDNNNPIYHHFVSIAKELKPSCISLITPSRWFAGGRRELTSFRNEMANDSHIRSMVNFINGKEVFPTSSTGSVSFFIWDRNYNGDCSFTSTLFGNSKTTTRRLNEFIDLNVVVGNNIALEIVRKVMSKNEAKFSDNVKPYMPFGLRSYERGQKFKTPNSVALYTSDGVFYRDRGEIPEGSDYIDSYKIMTSKLLAEHAGEPDKSGKYKVLSRTEIIKPCTACTESYLILAESKEKSIIDNCFSYCTTRFFRFLLLQAMSSINMTSDVFVFVPNQDFSKSWTDKDLYKKYDLKEDEIKAIETLIKPF